MFWLVLRGKEKKELITNQKKKYPHLLKLNLKYVFFKLLAVFLH